MTAVFALTAAVRSIAMLYSSVGHAGASGYLAMAIASQMPQEQMKAVALTLNIVVGSIGACQFIRSHHFHWPIFWPFGLGAIPMAYLGGLWQLPDMTFKPLIGFVLIFSAGMLIVRAVQGRSPQRASADVRLPPWPIALMLGMVLGLLAGLTGPGGDISIPAVAARQLGGSKASRCGIRRFRPAELDCRARRCGH
ncbi:MAG TPA: sulfite exporter TauE/SafE family protein [Phycisphaerales bacterium]|nr:sulfite exporter TauE/SafE family protein [Phycisphaerales bacterium]